MPELSEVKIMADFINSRLTVRDGPGVTILARKTHHRHQNYQSQFHLKKILELNFQKINRNEQ